MGKISKTSKEPLEAPAFTPEEREKQLISLAVDLAEKQLAEGTASASVITHYLKLAAMKEKEKLEHELLATQIEVGKAKIESLKSAKDIENLYAEAMDAFKRYHGEQD